MNEPGASLVTTYTFKGGKEYIIKMKVTTFKGCQHCLELTVTDKYTSEDWQSTYDMAYIENLTHKTGNFKQFDVFVAMLQSGLIKTSECITLDLLTFEDLELLRARKVNGCPYKQLSNKANNRRYLILTYTVEFDRIHYPLPLEYCGLPDPAILQATIRKLQTEIERLHATGLNKNFQKQIEKLTIANQKLIEENHRLSSGGKSIQRLIGTVNILESNVAKERTAFRTQIQKLRAENAAQALKIRQLMESTGRRPGDGSPALKRRTPSPSLQSRRSTGRSRSQSPSIRGRLKTSSLSPGTSIRSFRIRNSSRQNVKSRQIDRKWSKTDFANLESRIHTLQKMLKEGINLN